MIKLYEVGPGAQGHNRQCSGILWYHYDPVRPHASSKIYCDEVNYLHPCGWIKGTIRTEDTELIKKIANIKKEKLSDPKFMPLEIGSYQSTDGAIKHVYRQFPPLEKHPNENSWQGALVKELQKEQSFNTKRNNLLKQLDKLWNDVATDNSSDAYVLMKVKEIRDELATLIN